MAINLEPQEAGHVFTQATHNAPGELNLRHSLMAFLRKELKKARPPSASHHRHPSRLPPPALVI